MGDPMIDQLTRLKLKLLEKKLERERGNYEERADSAASTRSYDGQAEALHSALRRKRDLLQRLREQHWLDELTRPHTWGGAHSTRRPDPVPPFPQVAPPIHIYQPPAPAPAPAPAPPALPPPPAPPRIIQHTIPQQPATIIQQLPQQQPLITQIPPPQAPSYRSGSIKEDMVELMLMQNAQMHQIIMHNMMLKAIPPMALSPAGGFGQGFPATSHSGQENYMKPKGSAVHHHHHYSPSVPQLPPIGYAVWPPMMSSGQGGTYQPTVHHLTNPVSLPPLNT
ncbi:uncharacterized protein C21orf58 homolog [Chanos chanos]|uniref:Uncharacterized protein C21orf58 homolog n=1 Tax=Chanos chanos TaxID=29144 RepID=A0A6J2W2W5_CHACN|nr:uncharacterized protein C21orf58-like [Chanos chanos]